MQAVAALKLKTPVVGVIAAAENMICAAAYRPDDIITTMSGQTVEIVSADAEGRMVEIDTDDPRARLVYRETWEERREMLQAMAYRLNIILLPVRTDEEIHLTLIHNLEHRARSRAV